MEFIYIKFLIYSKLQYGSRPLYLGKLLKHRHDMKLQLINTKEIYEQIAVVQTNDYSTFAPNYVFVTIKRLFQSQPSNLIFTLFQMCN